MRRALPWILCSALAACESPFGNGGGGGGGDDDSAADDDAVEVDESLDATLEISPLISTVGTVRWTTDEPGTSAVEFGPDAGYGHVTPDDGALRTEHEVVLAGIPSSATWHWRARSVVSGRVHVSPDQSVTTLPAPATMPVVTQTRLVAGKAAGGYRSTSFLGASGSQAAIIGPDGKYVWWVDAGANRLVSRSVVSRDLRSVHFFNQGLDHGVDTSEILTWSLDLQVESSTRTVMGHHDFVELPDGRFAYLKLDCRPVGGYDYPICGDTIVEIEAGDPDGGTAVDVWSAWDPDEGLPLEVSDHAVPSFYPQGIDWLHGNGIEWEEDLGEAGGYLYSSRELSAVFAIDATTGQLLWQAGGQGSDFGLVPGGKEYVGQHSPDLLGGDHLLVFDNGTLGHAAAAPEVLDSAAREYFLDFQADPPTYEEVWSYVQGGSSMLLGDVQRLDNGNTLVSWGSLGVMNEISPEGEVVWEASLAIGSTFAFATYHEQIGGTLP